MTQSLRLADVLSSSIFVGSSSSYEFSGDNNNDDELVLRLPPGDELISSDEIPPSEFKTAVHPHSAPIPNLEFRIFPPRQEEPLRPHEVLTVQSSIYLQCLSELSGPARQLPHLLLSSILLHQLDPLEWLEGPDENRTRDSPSFSLHAQTVMEPIREVDIRAPSLAEHHPVSWRLAPEGMTRRLVSPSVGLDFDQHAGKEASSDSPDEQLA